ncbi:hypothetical protein [Methylobacterium nodulans]|uniref:Uncharacterized protein n=1 Tax=Methylobacterium nodulans (strain LMG 21967 / CNCM I-2342 / ORS 2060) TaxID=460265 RepID=B8IXA3_METNO|nr:hypothetical protein [Methylobacterium nodulans]ACL63144.1 conserved hypothetical protein [Methylobacterium nodulans ORS 2060]
MDARQHWPMTHGEPQVGVREAWLLGQPGLQDFLDYVEDHAVGVAALSRSALVDEWRAANDYYHHLELNEAGAADAIEVRDLDPTCAELADAVRADPRYRRAFDKVPTRFAMVELDRLVVAQSHIDLDHADRLQARAGDRLNAQALFRFCQPLGDFEAPVQIRQAGARRYLFVSASSDLRFHECLLLKPQDLANHAAFGSVSGAVGLIVGFGSNFLSVVQSESRLLLHNGHHRAYALRAMGVRFAPCIIQTATRGEELGLLASSKVMASPSFYFRAARPPLLKDFFEPRIRKVLQVRRTSQVIELSFEVKDYSVRSLDDA